MGLSLIFRLCRDSLLDINRMQNLNCQFRFRLSSRQHNHMVIILYPLAYQFSCLVINQLMSLISCLTNGLIYPQYTHQKHIHHSNLFNQRCINLLDTNNYPNYQFKCLLLSRQ